ncbi:hypothetical protein FKM82_021537 [Ascaphus truei]
MAMTSHPASHTTCIVFSACLQVIYNTIKAAATAKGRECLFTRAVQFELCLCVNSRCATGTAHKALCVLLESPETSALLFKRAYSE